MVICVPQVVVEHRKETPNQPPYFLRGLKDFTALDGDEVRLSVKLAGLFFSYVGE